MRRLVIPTKEGSKYFEKMSLYDELPVFKASYDLLLSIFHFTANFKREYKYTVGERLKNETLALIVLVYRANSSKEKVEVIQQAREQSAGTPSLPTGTPSLLTIQNRPSPM
ncbi:MAG: four helix bundle protein [Bacteroidales bacterium]|jgi:hypothetical protein